MKIKIVVEFGMVRDVFSTGDCDIEIIDLDSQDFDEREKLEEYVRGIKNSGEFKIVG